MSRRQRGAALLLVMWLTLLLAGLVAGYALTARMESLQGNGLARDVAARQAARAGVEYAVSRLLEQDPAQRWSADGSGHPFTFDGAQVDIEIRDEDGKIDLNGATHDLLMAFFIALGEPRESATRLAGAIIDWRDEDTLTQPAGGAEDADYASAGLAWGAKDAPFETVAEVEQVLGMRASLFAAAAQHLTVFTGNPVPDAGSADSVVLQAMGVQRAAQIDPNAAPDMGSGTYSIDSRARLADGRHASLSVVLRVGSSGLPGSTYTPLRWQSGGVGR